jgi:hypothetical protein
MGAQELSNKIKAGINTQDLTGKRTDPYLHYL